MLRTREGTPATMLSAHPAAEIFPLLTGDERADLVADIRARGLLKPITLHPDGRILDGRNRYEACLEVGVPVRFETWDGEPGDEVAWVLSMNLRRRHLSESQRALVAARRRVVEAEIAATRRGARTDLRADLRGGSYGKASEKAGDALGVSARSVDSAARVLRDGVPELVAAVERGDASVDAASQVATLPPDEQARVVELGDDEILRRAKEIRERRKGSARAALTSSESVEHYTPEDIVWIARTTMGGIDLDPASCAEANEVVQAKRIFTVEDDGLSRYWLGRVFLNSPYGLDDEGESNLAKWTGKLREEFAIGRVEEAVNVVNAATSAKWFAPLTKFAICFPWDRVRFRKPGGEVGEQPTNGTAIVYLGPNVAAFVAAVKDERFGPDGYGWVVVPSSAGLVSISVERPEEIGTSEARDVRPKRSKRAPTRDVLDATRSR